MTLAMKLLYAYGPHEELPMSEAVDISLLPVQGADCGLLYTCVHNGCNGLLEDMMGVCCHKGMALRRTINCSYSTI